MMDQDFLKILKNFLGEPYIRSKNPAVNSKSGLGLGIFIGKTLLERMKANVQLWKKSNNIKWCNGNY